MDISGFPEAAREAIRRGVGRGDPVVFMEFLGLPLRVINLLEESDFGIVKLEDLIQVEREDLLSIASMADVSVDNIYSALKRYHELDEIKAEEEAEPPLRTLDDVTDTEK
jgi:hypothetical protein